MARITLRARRFFSLIVPLFFISAVYAEQTPEPAKSVTVEAKMKSSPLSIPINTSHGKRLQSNQNVKTR